MRAAGRDPASESTDTATPEGIGNVAAVAVIEHRRHDGANQHGDEPGCNGKPYSDYTGYKPVNPHDTIVDPDRWQESPSITARAARSTCLSSRRTGARSSHSRWSAAISSVPA